MFSLTDKCFVIAEAGTCHSSVIVNDRLDKAKRYVLAARDARADCIKFQIFDHTELFCPYEGDEQRKARWDSSILRPEDWWQIKEFTEACGMMFLASVFQHSMVEMLVDMKIEATKVASRAAQNFPYDDDLKPFLVSDGMSSLGDFSGTAVFRLECEAKYPSTAIWQGKYGPNGGFSDHSGTPWRAVDAISRGCKLIEVHFCIDPLDAGPDLPASLDLDELKLVCEARDAFAELRRNE